MFKSLKKNHAIYDRNKLFVHREYIYLTEIIDNFQKSKKKLFCNDPFLI